mmetsp:Transcript_94679/g.276867  ORF Transcript_94679/g.276867 Transcript_94679/m.276867 type:complete len:303 (+) Transcript_94679:1241-2149(+)
MQLSQFLRCFLQVLLSHRQVTLCCRLPLPRLRKALLRGSHLPLRYMQLVLQRLLQHGRVLCLGGLGLPAVVQLRLCLVQQALHRLDDDAAVVLVGLRGWGAQLVTSVREAVLAFGGRGGGVLDEGGEPGGVGRAEGGGLDQGGEGLGEAAHAAELGEGGAALGLPLQNVDAALNDIDCVQEVLLRVGEVACLLVSDQRGCLEVRLVCGDGRGELLDLRAQALHRVCGLLDGRLEVLMLRLHGAHRVLRLPRAVLAPLRELVVDLRGRRPLLQDPCLQLAQELQRLLHWVAARGSAGRRQQRS